jgi:hypothetical protein
MPGTSSRVKTHHRGVVQVRWGFCSSVVAFFGTGRRSAVGGDLGGTLSLEKERWKVMHQSRVGEEVSGWRSPVRVMTAARQLQIHCA